MDVGVTVGSPEDLAPSLERLLGIPLEPDEIAYLESLGAAVIRAVLEARPR